jgi:hypothetical protein
MVATNVTTWVCEPVVRFTVLELAVSEEIEGAWLSVLETDTVAVLVDEFPALSNAVIVSVSDVVPKE